MLDRPRRSSTLIPERIRARAEACRDGAVGPDRERLRVAAIAAVNVAVGANIR